MPIFSTMRVSNFYVSTIKPVCDLFFAFTLLIISLPFQILIAVVLSLHFWGSPFFVHQRAGKDEKVFSLIKFRTMKVEFNESSTTALGKFLRSYSLDELPQLLNVLKGEMSFVGPRPLLIDYLRYYDEEEKIRHEVRPGITGWAQVNGRNAIDWGRRMSLDMYYVRNVSFGLDLKILAKTLIEVFKRDKTSYKNEKTITFSEYASKR